MYVCLVCEILEAHLANAVSQKVVWLSVAYGHTAEAGICLN